MAQAGIGLGYVVVDISSDSDGESTTEDESEPVDGQNERDRARGVVPQSEYRARNTVDLTGAPDTDIIPDEPRIGHHGNSSQVGVLKPITEAECLQMILNILPDISVDYILNLIRENTTDQTRTVDKCEQIVAQLLDGTHPTEADATNKKKRKRDNEDDVTRYEKGEHDRTKWYEEDA
jgi:TRIAD3 protein (E3 ubiquitin-protein ligase RNF216)